VKQTESELSRVKTEVANKVNAKLQSVLEGNPRYSTLCKVSDIFTEMKQNLVEINNNFLPTILLFSSTSPLRRVM
jgi:predicted transcriptional regulator